MRQSTKGWLGVLGGVVAYEIFCEPGELLSERVDEWLEHPVKRLGVYALVGLTALHLLNYLEHEPLQKIDPWHQLGKIATSVVEREVLEE